MTARDWNASREFRLRPATYTNPCMVCGKPCVLGEDVYTSCFAEDGQAHPGCYLARIEAWKARRAARLAATPKARNAPARAPVERFCPFCKVAMAPTEYVRCAKCRGRFT